MRTVRVFVGVVELALGGAASGSAALAESNDRDGPWVYSGSSSNSSPREHAIERGGPSFFDRLFGNQRDYDGYDDGYGRATRTGEPVDVEPVQPTEKIVVYQPDKLVPLST